MKHDIPHLDAAGLRRFGLQTAAIACVLFGVLLPWIVHAAYPRWPWIIGGVLGLWSLLAPATLRPFYAIWMRLSMVIGGVMNPIFLGIVFFVVISPIGLMMRVFGHNPMGRGRDASVPTYRNTSRPLSKNNMEKPF